MRQLFFKIIALFPKVVRDTIPVDKLMHFVAGAMVAFPFWFFGYGLLGMLAAAAVGVGKEVYDTLSNLRNEALGLKQAHTVEWLDAVATAVGGVAVFFTKDIVVFVVSHWVF
jgi:hypothetical protein